MKKTSAILLLLCCNALFIFLEVHKQGQYVKLSYDLQKLQSRITILEKEHSNLLYNLHAEQQPDIIEKKVEQQMSMQRIELKNILRAPKESMMQSTQPIKGV
jgi:cell division protein FtsL